MESSLLHFLIVTDDPITGATLDRALKAEGHQATLVGSSRAQEKLDHSFPASFVDSRRDPRLLERVLQSVPYVVALGERDNTEEILKALRSGANDFLPRQFRSLELQAVLSRAASGQDFAPALLEYSSPTGEKVQAKVHGKIFSLGRDPSNHLCLESAVVSRFHAQLLRRAEDFLIVDKESRHGLFVNDERVDERILHDGDQVRLGGPSAPVLVFRLSEKSLPTDSDSVPALGSLSSRELKDISALLDTFLTLNSDLLLDDLLQLVIARSIELAQAERGMILLAAPSAEGEEPKGLRLAMARDQIGQAILEEGLSISRKIPEEVMATGKGVILDDLLAPDHIGVHPATIQIGVRSAMCVPLRARRGAGGSSGPPEMIGVLYVDSSSRARPFSPRLLHALDSLASEAAQAILNARLYEVSLEKRQLDEEIRIAHGIQQNLLPPSSFQNPWMELKGTSQACYEVGGDFLNYYPFEDTRLGLALGDVSGKGIPAAIFSAMLDGLCYGMGAPSSSTQDLGEVAGKLNRYLVAKSGLQKFVSLFFGVIWDDGSLGYVNAGHNPPLWIDPSGEVDFLRSGGMVMGMFEDAAYASGEILLQPGDVLVLYSDGITEGRARSGKRFGLERLKRCVVENRKRSAGEIHDAVAGALRDFLEDAPASDDVTLMVVNYRGRNPS
jgi:serine phosphatase RsbU (regulator of sigma subunit)/pSer/pThr/pTyr-binding forkhead associated (FHA) protein